jgi:hypothetical protein
LRAAPHRLLGDVLKTTLQLLGSYDLRSVEELKEHKPRPEDQCQLIEHLASYDGFSCLRCTYYTRHLPRIKEHVASHKVKDVEQRNGLLWRECKLQTYFTAGGRIDYFVVTYNNEKEGFSGFSNDSALLMEPEKELFEKLEKDYKDVKCDLEEQVTVV